MNNKATNIVDYFSDYRRVLNPYPWMIHDERLNNLQVRRLSIPISAETRLFDVDISERVISIARNEINQDISKTITKSLFDTTKFDYLDLRSDGSLQNTRIFRDKLIGMILSENYRNLITTALITSSIQDSSSFQPYMTTDDVKTSGALERMGKLGKKVDIQMDPFMKFNDGRICLFNEVYFNIQDMKAIEVVNPLSMVTNILVEWKFALQVGDSKLIFVIEDENSESFNQYKSLQRDIKIDNILDGK